jgi:hypothetical protein
MLNSLQHITGGFPFQMVVPPNHPKFEHWNDHFRIETHGIPWWLWIPHFRNPPYQILLRSEFNWLVFTGQIIRPPKNSMENPWFPVSIFPNKPIHWEIDLPSTWPAPRLHRVGSTSGELDWMPGKSSIKMSTDPFVLGYHGLYTHIYPYDIFESHIHIWLTTLASSGALGVNSWLPCSPSGRVPAVVADLRVWPLFQQQLHQRLTAKEAGETQRCGTWELGCEMHED